MKVVFELSGTVTRWRNCEFPDELSIILGMIQMIVVEMFLLSAQVRSLIFEGSLQRLLEKAALNRWIQICAIQN